MKRPTSNRLSTGATVPVRRLETITGCPVCGLNLRAVYRAMLGHRSDPDYAGIGSNHSTTHLGLPADFLIDADGMVVALRYGWHADDQWSVDELLDIQRSVGRP